MILFCYTQNSFYCPVCGCVLKEKFSIGFICPCCGNEREDLDLEYYFKILFETRKLEESDKEIPKEMIDYLQGATYVMENYWKKVD